jgi:hypothetical protein
MIIRNQSFDDYQAIDAINFSALKAMQVSDRAFVHAMAHRSGSTDAMDQGSYLHSILLDPHTILSKYAIWDGGRRAGKEWYLFCDANEGKTILKADDVNEIGNWAAMCESDPVVGDELRAITARELTVAWTHKATNLPCKSRIDGTYDRMIVDVKTSAKATPEEFERDAMYRFYPAQMAYYIDAMATETGTDPSTWGARIIAIFKGDTTGQYPADCWITELSEEVIEHGRQLYRGWLRRAATIDRKNPMGAGYGKRQLMILPAWAESQLPMAPITSGADGEYTMF